MKKAAISQVDALFASGIYPIEFLFYFDRQLETRSLRKALKKTASSFWPVFGRLSAGLITFDGFKEDDFYGEKTFSEDFPLPESEEEKWKAYSPLRLLELSTLFFFKVLNFKNGTVLIAKMNHMAGDGYSYFYFLSVLAGLSRTNKKPFPSSLSRLFAKPHHRRTAVKEFFFRGGGQALPVQSDTFTLEHMEISKNELSSLLRAASSRNIRISANDVLSAAALQRIVGSKGVEFGNQVRLTIPIDVRRKVKAYGPRFFGNGLLFHTHVFEKQEIAVSSREKIAARIRESMPAVSAETYRDYLLSLEHLLSEGNPRQIRPFDPLSGCLVTNLSRLPTDKLDFGSGFPKLVYPLTVEKNAAAVLSKGDNFALRWAH